MEADEIFDENDDGIPDKVETDDFFDGFWFALMMFDAMGKRVSLKDVRSFLESVVTGEVSMIDSPEDRIRQIEKDAGRRLPDDLRATIYRMQKSRKEDDAARRSSAKRILTTMGIDVPD